MWVHNNGLSFMNFINHLMIETYHLIFKSMIFKSVELNGNKVLLSLFKLVECSYYWTVIPHMYIVIHSNQCTMRYTQALELNQDGYLKCTRTPQTRRKQMRTRGNKKDGQT